MKIEPVGGTHCQRRGGLARAESVGAGPNENPQPDSVSKLGATSRRRVSGWIMVGERRGQRSHPALYCLVAILFSVAASLSAPTAFAATGAPLSPPVPVGSLPPAVTASSSPRHVTDLETDWRTIALATGEPAPAGVEQPGFNDTSWRTVSVPHNWDAYEGFHQVRHGDLHGTAWYRRSFPVSARERDRRIFLFFEGVGSYASVWVNGQNVGHHAGGLTTFTLDITPAVHFGAENLLVVRADHPAGIRDLPWVCGGCERAYGFSEGTQPFGIFRPVHLITIDPVRIEPFGVQVWNDATVTAASAAIHVRTEIKNYGTVERTFTLVTRVFAPRDGELARGDIVNDIPELGSSTLAATPLVSETRTQLTLAAGGATITAQEPPPIANARLWSPRSPALYTIETTLQDSGGAALDRLTTPFGIRTVHWAGPSDSDGRFLVNGQPVFINGVCDYEHNLGASHAFTPEQIHARVSEIEAGGFNAFRDAHHPHNLRFQSYWDADGLLWWAQFGAHVWFDNDAFRANFKARLRDWVKERRNSPSLVLWGLQNESVLPTDFAEECSALIRELDPTASTQRKITTCNGGTGTDWDVPQNWSGTYSGDLAAYGDDLRREHLVGEYGAWRSLGFHSEGGFQQHGPLTEDRMTALLETKVRLAESVRGEVSGHFMWPFTTHSNPGRNVGEHGEQQDDGIRPLDQISPANNKGLFTIWGEPLDAYYMYQGNYAPAKTEPMVYIVSHTWPDRWTTPGRKSGIIVYSNCDEVELFNDLGDRSLGRRTRAGRGTHFEWDNVEIETNILYAEGRIGGKVVARDLIQFHHLPDAPRFAALARAQPDPLAPEPDRNYLYRVNCGGPDYTDTHGNRWAADREYSRGDSWGSISWAAAYPSMDPRFGSLRRTYEPIFGTRDPALFQTYRYGRDELHYRFRVPNGDYDVELYFAEPWYGPRTMPPFKDAVGAAAGESSSSAAGWRLFDVAINGSTELRNLDLWRLAGRAYAVKKVVAAHVTGETIDLSFPRVAAGQAVISAIAISTRDGALAREAAGLIGRSPALIRKIKVADVAHADGTRIRQSLDTGDATYTDIAGGFTVLPAELLEADWIQTADASKDFDGGVSVSSATPKTDAVLELDLNAASIVYVAHDNRAETVPAWLKKWEHTPLHLKTNAAPGVTFDVYRALFMGSPQGPASGTGAYQNHVILGPNSDHPGSGSPMYSVFVVPHRAAPPPVLVRMTAPGTPQGTTWKASGDVRAGRELCADASVRIASVPENLVGGDLVYPLQDSAGPVEFTVTDYVEVSVAVDPRQLTPRTPDWLSNWIETRDTVRTSAPETPKYVLFRRRFAPDSRVHIGSNRDVGSPACFAIVRTVRPSVFLSAKAAIVSGAASRRSMPEATDGTVIELPPGSRNSVAWVVSVGVGDRYGLDFHYTATTASEDVPAELTIVGADGQVVRTDKLEFPAIPTANAWSFLRTRTGASINAGTYTFHLTLSGRTPLVIDSLEVE